YEEYETLATAGRIHIFKKIKAVDLWKKMIAMLFETGHPWITFKDPSNIRSPQDHVGVINSSNLCTEIMLNTSADETAVCNLGSLNLAKHITNGKLDSDLMENTVKIAIRMLDNVIDLNFYPIPEARNANMKHRPVGLGIMGFADTLFALDIPFDSEECEDFADESMEMIAKCAISASSELAKERGAYQTFQGSKWDRGIFPVDTLDILERERGEKIAIPRSGKLDWKNVRDSVKQFGMRNSNCLAIAPTATIANIAGVFPSIEPIYKNLYVKSNLSGEFIINNPYLVSDLKKLKLWNEEMIEEIKRQDGSIQNISTIPQNIKEKYKETFEIDAQRLIRIAGRRGKWIDQSQSLNLFAKGASGKGISDMYFYAWELGLKTTYYLRTLAASGIEKSTIALERQARPITETAPLCKIGDPACEACQ
ncbi:ribonucleoside-diphosphate reductase subunit alpha, partial [Candidatus Peregrinibacteria bacterium]|nr:ribonucleoside-diphosphate reductase subunit alpha [Candidatus Peregrinibacteria bacterium]